jgi:hypothetical protein
VYAEQKRGNLDGDRSVYYSTLSGRGRFSHGVLLHPRGLLLLSRSSAGGQKLKNVSRFYLSSIIGNNFQRRILIGTRQKSFYRERSVPVSQLELPTRVIPKSIAVLKSTAQYLRAVHNGIGLLLSLLLGENSSVFRISRDAGKTTLQHKITRSIISDV